MNQTTRTPTSPPDIDGDENGFSDALAGRTGSLDLGLLGAAESRLLEIAEDGKAELVRSIDGLVMLAHEFAAKLDSSNVGPVGAYVRQAAGAIEDLQATLRDRPVKHLLDDGRDLVRRSPQVAIAVAVAAGFIAARLFKSGTSAR